MNHIVKTLAIQDVRRWKTYEADTWQGTASYRRIIDFYKDKVSNPSPLVQAALRFRMRCECCTKSR